MSCCFPSYNNVHSRASAFSYGARYSYAKLTIRTATIFFLFCLALGIAGLCGKLPPTETFTSNLTLVMMGSVGTVIALYSLHKLRLSKQPALDAGVPASTSFWHFSQTLGAPIPAGNPHPHFAKLGMEYGSIRYLIFLVMLTALTTISMGIGLSFRVSDPLTLGLVFGVSGALFIGGAWAFRKMDHIKRGINYRINMSQLFISDLCIACFRKC